VLVTVEGCARDLLYQRGRRHDDVMSALRNPSWKPPGERG